MDRTPPAPIELDRVSSTVKEFFLLLALCGIHEAALVGHHLITALESRQIHRNRCNDNPAGLCQTNRSSPNITAQWHHASLPQGLAVGGGDMGADHFPAEIGESDPGLALAADEVLSANFELEVGSGEIAPERQYFEPDPLLLDARPRLAVDAVPVDFIETVAMLGHGIPNGVGAVPKGVVENSDILVDQSFFIALE